MQVRQDKEDLVGYTFAIEELVVIKAALDNQFVQAFIITARTNYITDHLMQSLSKLKDAGPDVDRTIAMEEAYLKGAMDFANTLLDSIILPGEN